MKQFIFILISTFAFSLICFSQSKMTYKTKIAHVKKDFAVSELANKAWKNTGEILIDKYWSGENAPVGRHAKAKILWSDTAIYVRFEANRSEPLIVAEKPNLTSKTKGLWDRDVCEIFLAPDKADFRHYYEFEIAPTGEWVDLGIYQMLDKRETDWDYHSGMQSKSVIEKDKITMAIKIEWKAFGKVPKVGDVWMGNIFRCVGTGATRGYLAWSPTLTKEASFHVPEKFGELEFGE